MGAKDKHLEQECGAVSVAKIPFSCCTGSPGLQLRGWGVTLLSGERIAPPSHTKAA